MKFQSGVGSALLILGTLIIPTHADEARDLTFEQRVKAQEAIERAYYSHRIGETRSFAEAVPRSLLREKVRKYLKESVALEKFWNTPITADALDKELERMTRRTRMPARLQELFLALGNDPFLIRECLARPVLAGRLVREYFSSDQELHSDERRAAVDLRKRLLRGEIDWRQEAPNRSVTEFLQPSSGEEVQADRREPSRQVLSADEFHQLAMDLPETVGGISPIAETSDGYVSRVLLEKSKNSLRIATFDTPKEAWGSWWSRVESALDEASVAAVAGEAPRPQQAASVPSCAADDRWLDGTWEDVPDPRYGHTAVWTGSLMLIWGGNGDISGGRYDPATDSWEPMSRIGAPSPRDQHTAIWTGSMMIIWGGIRGTALNTGGRYDPQTDTWSPTSTLNAASRRNGHTAVWTGSAMVIWGRGFTDAVTGHHFRLNTGGRYDPVSDTWTATQTLNAGPGREFHTSVWTGRLMVVWGGTLDTGYATNIGGRYDPETNTWATMTTLDAPAPRWYHEAVWTGREMVVWGGVYVNTGGRYDPATDTWRATSTVDAPPGVTDFVAVWTGHQMVVWGGFDGAQTVRVGGRYDPVADVWTPTSVTNAPTSRHRHTAVWTGSLVVIWGGQGDNGNENTGGRYDPLTDSWTPTFTGNPPTARYRHTTVWTGTEMIVWGGSNFFSQSITTGGRYDPATDSWLPTTMTNAPSARRNHTAVWTGSVIVIWGGGDFPYLNTGGRYDPVADTWSPTSTTNAALPRTGHTAVWTGASMIVWGGYSDFGGVMTNSGGRYDPVSDTWASISSLDAPSARVAHRAVWTGDRMLVWGGSTGSSSTNTGGLYDPSMDRWTPTSLANAPGPLVSVSLVWTGNLALAWGNYLNQPSGGRYDPATDTWMPVTSTNAPVNRGEYSAAWTGNFLVVWGGTITGANLDSGGRYDPAADIWSPITLVGAPTPRYGHTAIWAGESMLVFGGYDIVPLNSGGRYCACVSMTYHADLDGDGYGNPEISLPACSPPAGYVADGSDCDDSVAQVWNVPSEVSNLLLPDPTTLVWDAPSFDGATTVLYDLIRSENPADFVSAGTCVATDTPSSTSTDFKAPATGAISFYLVRAQNSCPNGLGPLGNASNGTPRTGRSCP